MLYELFILSYLFFSTLCFIIDYYFPYYRIEPLEKTKVIKEYNKIIEDNKNKSKQTRVTYSITPKKSIELCEQFNLDYYYWSSSA